MDAFALETLDVPACQYGGEYPFCKLPPEPTAGSPPGSQPAGPEGTDPGSTGGTAAPPDTTAPDTACRTPKDSVLNSPHVQAGLADLWSRSNADAAMSQRLEKGGWVVQTATGYALQPWPDSWTIGPCGIDAPPGTVPPAGAVGWAHTHPYAKGERLTGCPADDVRVGGVVIPVHQTYLNDPSDSDGDASSRWGLPGYIIDKNAVTRFVGNAASEHKLEVTLRVGRCGY